MTFKVISLHTLLQEFDGVNLSEPLSMLNSFLYDTNIQEVINLILQEDVFQRVEIRDWLKRNLPYFLALLDEPVDGKEETLYEKLTDNDDLYKSICYSLREFKQVFQS